jgi:hypothetical protein
MAEEHKGLPVAGYVPQSSDNVALANELKFAEERYLRILDLLRAKCVAVDQRCVSLAFTSMQEANMWAVRAIFQPTRVKFPGE